MEVLRAFRLHLNTSIPQLEAEEGAQGKSSPHVCLLYLHSLAVFVSYISSNERKIEKINIHNLFHFICLFMSWQLCVYSECLNPPLTQESRDLFIIYRSFFSFIESPC